MPDMVNVRKSHAGTDSAGHEWPTDGAVIEVPVEHALVLARIPDGGFTVIESLVSEEDTEPTESAEPADKAPKQATARTTRAKPEESAPTK